MWLFCLRSRWFSKRMIICMRFNNLYTYCQTMGDSSGFPPCCKVFWNILFRGAQLRVSRPYLLPSHFLWWTLNLHTFHKSLNEVFWHVLGAAMWSETHIHVDVHSATLQAQAQAVGRDDGEKVYVMYHQSRLPLLLPSINLWPMTHATSMIYFHTINNHVCLTHHPQCYIWGIK